MGPKKNALCTWCNTSTDLNKLLLCDGHLTSGEPCPTTTCFTCAKVKTVPPGEYYCKNCLNPPKDLPAQDTNASLATDTEKKDANLAEGSTRAQGPAGQPTNTLGHGERIADMHAAQVHSSGYMPSPPK